MRRTRRPSRSRPPGGTARSQLRRTHDEPHRPLIGGMAERKNRIELLPSHAISMVNRMRGPMNETAHHYFIFETAGGFCGIAWNDVGITRFQLPTRSAEATERILLRRARGAKPGVPT